jgi:SagB-type dehydrogenase family enzyme
VIVSILLLSSFTALSQKQISIKLLPPQTNIGKPFMQALEQRKSTREFSDKKLPLQELSNLIWAGNGINRPETGKRTAPSAWNAQDIDLYVSTSEGLYIYDAKNHVLNQIHDKDIRAHTGGQDFVAEAPVNLVYVSNYKKFGERDIEDIKYYSVANVGFIAQNIYLYCASQGLVTVVRGMVNKSELANLMELEPEQNIILAQTVGYPKINSQTGADENNGLQVNVSPEDLRKFKSQGSVRYSDFGAKGDGKSDDIAAIAATHAFANQHNLPVKADEGATYYIGEQDCTAIIQTDTDFNTATFIIDDSKVRNRNASVFLVGTRLQPFKPQGISSLDKNQKKIDLSLPGPCLITVTNANVRRYIRFGPNQNDGSPQTDIFVVDKNGNVDKDTPIIWDFDRITDITALPMDETRLYISGGRFITIANQAESRYTYYNRNIAVRRSNVVIDGLEHRVTGEGEHGAPYSGFLNIRDCADVAVWNTIFTGHKTYRTIGSAGRPVSMGSYDITANRALNVLFFNCSQTNDINDRKYWGIIGSNYCKNLVYNSCDFSRFDAHMGVANAAIRNSTLGHMGINAIGHGILTVENSTINGRTLINLRSDYGSTWQGEFIIRNCTFVPAGGRPVSASLIGGRNTGKHDFGYSCTMPERITIETLHIDDSNHPEDYQGPAIFANFNPEMTDDSYREDFPYIKTKKVILRNVTTASGKALRLSDNPVMFKDVEIVTD